MTEFDKLPRLDVIPAKDVARWQAMTRDERETYAEETDLGGRITAFLEKKGRCQVWYPDSTPADYDVLELDGNGQIAVVPGHIVAAVAALEGARP